MSTREEMDEFIGLLPDNVGKGLEVVTRQTVPEGALLHISTNGKIKTFTPSVTSRTAHKEDRSVPRVSTAPSLLGCIAGYSAAKWDVLNNYKGNKDFKGGWYIYDLPFEFALKPAVRLLVDQKATDEHWLVTYSVDTRHYDPSIIGKFFYESLTSLTRTDNGPFMMCTIKVEVFPGQKVHFAKGVVLTEGYWNIYGPEPTNNIANWKQTKAYVVTPVTKADWAISKKFSADLLSHQL